MDEDDLLSPSGILPLTEECHHYTKLSQVPWDIQKYWHQRYSIFPNYDEDIYLTDDAWFGVTPQPVAAQIADDLPAPAGFGSPVVVDLFAGAGGNTIAFALSGRWERVIAIERDAATLACAQYNAAVHGVHADAITWVLGDCFDYLDRALQRPPLPHAGPGRSLDPRLQIRDGLDAAVLFASPPWGGISYAAQPVFDLATMQPYNLRALHDACRGVPHALYLPRTSDLQQLADLVPDDAPDKLDVIQYCMNGLSKALVAYFPSLHGDDDDGADDDDDDGSEAGGRKSSA